MPVRSFAAPSAAADASRRRAAMAELTPQDMAAKLLAAGLRAQRPFGRDLERPHRRHADGGDAGPVAPLRP